MKRMSLFIGGALAVSALALTGCRGGKSSEQPFHLFGDMDWQPKYKAQETGELFADKRVNRPIVEGTVAQETPPEDHKLMRGPDGAYLQRMPVEVTQELLTRGEDRFNVYCTPCHDKTGGGRGIVVQRGFPPPVSLTAASVQALPDGQIFDVITNGVRNMPSYRYQVPIEDRWAIVSWVRVLQHSQNATINDVPEQNRNSIDKEGSK